ncbi:MAG TPA: hypothetical protein DET40_16825 [Lentisphaeria bacterium]|nr:MAG: hypothetical protein A2X45_04630 [Lentisphaerae bacterium GWF2_50_93]HCE45205.1 hypothetical protein [Lentisphaeria bacterium]
MPAGCQRSGNTISYTIQLSCPRNLNDAFVREPLIFRIFGQKADDVFLRFWVKDQGLKGFIMVKDFSIVWPCCMSSE